MQRRRWQYLPAILTALLAVLLDYLVNVGAATPPSFVKQYLVLLLLGAVALAVVIGIRVERSAESSLSGDSKGTAKTNKRRVKWVRRQNFINHELDTSGLDISLSVIGLIVIPGIAVGIWDPSWQLSVLLSSIAGTPITEIPVFSGTELAILATCFVAILSYATYYRKVLWGVDMFLLTVLSSVVVWSAVTIAPALSFSIVRYYNRPFAGTIVLGHQHTMTFGFALGFAVTHAILIIPIAALGAILLAVISYIFDDWFSMDLFGDDGLIWWIYGIAIPVIFFVHPLLTEFTGWLGSGLIIGGVIGCVIGWFTIGVGGLEFAPILRAIVILIAVISLVEWLVCAWILSIGSSSALIWLLGAVAGLIAGNGLIASIQIWRIAAKSVE